MLGLPIAVYIARALIALIAMTVHEYAHARVAYAMGDSTARDMGKMTLDPRANVNWLGFMMFVLVGFGPLGQVPVNEMRMRNRRWGMLYSVAAGPISNLILAALFAIPIRLFNIVPAPLTRASLIPDWTYLLHLGVVFNLLLFLFNLIPLFPLDGWTIVGKLLPYDLQRTWYRYQRESMYVLFGLILLSFILPNLNFLSIVIYPPLDFLVRVLTGHSIQIFVM